MPHGDARRRHASQIKALPCEEVETDRSEHLLARQPDEAVRRCGRTLLGDSAPPLRDFAWICATQAREREPAGTPLTQ